MPVSKFSSYFYRSLVTGRHLAGAPDPSPDHLEDDMYKVGNVGLFISKLRLKRSNKSTDSGDNYFGEVCEIRESPYRIFKAAEAGDMDDFKRLYLADTTRLRYTDAKGRAAIHFAASKNHVRIIEFILDHGGEANMQDTDGNTALHVAVENSSLECLALLLARGANSSITNNDLYGPLHLAAKLNRTQIWRYYPIHEAVKMCLDSGAVISTQQHDLSTPAHLACAQGAMDIVKLMFQSQPDERVKCLSIKDAQHMTPLGADIETADKDGRSALLLAGCRGAWKAMLTLIQLGANVMQRDQCSRNILHHIVLSGGNLDQFTAQIPKESITQLLNERDVFGCTPMHYASRDGHLKTIQSLIQLGAVINLKNNENQSPLHFACKYGRYNTVRHLLESPKGHLIINEMDGEGMSPLHISSENGHTKVVQLLLVKGALLHRDHKGRTPLHYAASNGYTKTMQQLVLVHSHLLDQADREGNTPLHLSVINNKGSAASLLLSLNAKMKKNAQGMTPIDYALHFKHSEVAMAMVLHPTRGDDIISTDTKRYNCLIEGLAANMPDVMAAMLDKCITRSEQSEDSKQYYVKYDFRLLECRCTGCSTQHLPFMNLMIRHRREELMSHPLCTKYLESKWNAYGMYFHLINLAFYTIFLASLTLCATEKMSSENFFPNITSAGAENQHIQRPMGQHEKGFYSPTISMVRVSTMMLGELDFLSTFLQPLRRFAATDDGYWRQMTAATWFLVVFAVLMPILLMNLLIGLAVGDIETVRRNASMKRLTMQVDMHTSLERRLPKQILSTVNKAEMFDYPNKRCKATLMWSMMQKVFMNCDESQKRQQRWTSMACTNKYAEFNQSIVQIELHKQRKRLREITKLMNQQYGLVRLIVQKMEIPMDSLFEVSELDCDMGDSCGEPTPQNMMHQ
ncbi:Transient receptor potential cation channel subfamily A member 1 [Halotydeus destructor]|nr:Transient receptor potential cation channel subfamily A member 1 [Halotydeus destructor]